MALSHTLAATPLPHTVAADDLGTVAAAARVLSGSPWTMPESVIAADHSIIFGDEVCLGYDSLVAAADYEIELTFASDSPNRKLRVMADDEVLAAQLDLPHNGELKATYPLPRKAAAAGRFELRIRKVAGENAVLSAAVVRSSDPQPLTVPPIVFPDVTLTPLPATTAHKTSLNGTWKFLPQAPADITKLSVSATADWKPIEVPGQWRNQGHDLPPDQTVAYATTFKRPAGSLDRLTKIRFDAVFSKCQVYLNGRHVGAHEGGFTPFECDLTKALVDQDNLLVLAVTSTSLAATMASASQYACHQLGGISRDVTLFIVPEVHVSDLAVRTHFDAAYKDAILEIALELTGRGSADLSFNLLDRAGKVVPLANATTTLEWSKPGPLQKTFTFPVTSPQWWTPETPNLYHLEIRCGTQLIRQPLGFREIEVKGTRVLVNGRPVKLRGINRHEADPLRGRSLAPGQWRTDVQLFRDANVNLIRTCHYPPAHALVEAADELGVWVELEAPFCWESGSGDPSHREVAMRQTAEAIKRDRNNPCVLFWSLGNESQWGSHFERSAKMAQALDPTRPRTFEWMNNNITTADAASCAIAAVHYPGFNGPKIAKAQSQRPVFMGEYCHLNAYNRRELMTDPGLRDRWGLYLFRLWEQMDAEPNILGGAIWSGIDDTFFPAADLTIGYGAWGPVDGWRRPKPEYWHMKKVYSPVRIDESTPVSPSAGTITIPVGNRSDFVNLSTMEARWKIGGQSGTVRADVPPRQHGHLTLKPATVGAGDNLELTFLDPRGFETNRFMLPITPTPDERPPQNTPVSPTLTTTAETYQVQAGTWRWSIDRMTGALGAKAGDIPVVTGGPHLMLIAHNGEGETQMTGPTKIHDAYSPACTHWQLTGIHASQDGDNVLIEIQGSYAEAEGAFTLAFGPKGLELSCRFTIKQELDPRQTGVAFDFAPGFDRLSWTRRGLWSAYPDDHIGRLTGTALAVTPDGKSAIEIGPRENPGKSPWANDNTRYGCNDFRSTKENILTAALSRTTGSPSFEIASDASQAVRAWRNPSSMRNWLLIANHTSGGSERFLQGLTAPDRRPLKPGAILTTTILINPP